MTGTARAFTLVQFRAREAMLFRDARPFDAGEQVSARARLPEPGTLFGALRTAALGVVCADVRAYGRGARCATCEGVASCPALELSGPAGSAGSPDHPGWARSIGSFMVDGSRPDSGAAARLFCPTPLLLSKVGEATDARLALTIPRPIGDGCAWNSTLPEAALPVGCDPVVPVPDGVPEWTSVAGIATLLGGRIPSPGWPAWSLPRALYESEPRTGLARDPDTSVGIDGMLYRAEYRRFHHEARMAAVVEGELPVAPVAFLGGRGRLAEVSTDPITWPPCPPPTPDPGRFAVALATPGYFTSGWHPALPAGARLAAAVVGPPLASQGWDVARGQPRPMRWLCPAGSVWWVDAETHEAAAQVVGWHGRTICEDRPHAGYGLAFVGRWEPGGS